MVDDGGGDVLLEGFSSVKFGGRGIWKVGLLCCGYRPKRASIQGHPSVLVFNSCVYRGHMSIIEYIFSGHKAGASVSQNDTQYSIVHDWSIKGEARSTGSHNLRFMPRLGCPAETAWLGLNQELRNSSRRRVVSAKDHPFPEGVVKLRK